MLTSLRLFIYCIKNEIQNNSTKIANRCSVSDKRACYPFRDARLKRGWTQQELAMRAGTSIPTIQRLERGNSLVSLSTVGMVCWLLELGLFPAISQGKIEYLKSIARERQCACLLKPDDQF